MALPAVDYSPRDPAADVLRQMVRQHLQTFLAQAAHRRDGQGVPRLVEDEFQAFLSCGSSGSRCVTDWVRCPPFHKAITDAQLKALVAYLDALRRGAPRPGSARPRT